MPDSRSRRPRLPELFVALLALTAAGVVTFAATAPPPAPHSTRLPALQGAAFRPDPRPLPGALGPVAVSGTINGAAQSVTCPVGDQGTVTLQITGTWVATMIFEGTVDNLTWATVRANALASDTLVTGATANGLFVLAGNFTAIRVRDTAYTSGAAVVTMRATPSSSANVPVSSVGGSGGGGSVTQGTSPWVVSGTVTANQGGAPWSVSGSGTFGVTQSTSPWIDAGNLTNNNAAPGVANFGALVALANAGVPTWTEGDQVLLSTDLSGRLRTSNTPTGTQTISGTVTANAGTGSFITQGTSAAAAAVSGNPVSIGGRDASGNSQFIGGNNNGVFAQGPVAAGAAVAGNPLRTGMVDNSGNIQGWSQTITTLGQFAGSTGVGAVSSMLNDNGAGFRNQVGFFSDAQDNRNVAYSGRGSFNGATVDRDRNNVDATLLASAARTTTQTSADIVTYNAHSLICTLDMTTVGTGSVTLTINYKDPASGKYILLLSGAAVTTNSTNVYTINPNIPAVANVSAQKDLGRVIQFVVTANNANSAVYSLGDTLIN